MQTLKTSLSEHEQKVLEKSISKYLRSRKFESNNHPDRFKHTSRFSQMDQICGFAYTSSGCYAGYFITHIELYFDFERKYLIYGFGMDELGHCFADIHSLENGLETFYIYI